MELFYWKSAQGNVGDDLNAWLWPRVFGADYFTDSGAPSDGTRFLGIGSILTAAHLLPRPGKSVVFGSGLRSEDVSELAGHDIELVFVRGPRSSAALGGAPWISDPAILTPLHFERLDPIPGRIGFVPYMRTPPAVTERICAETGTVCIPVTMDVESFCTALTKCEYVVCEAMHGAIFADAFRVPWAGCRISSALYEGPTSFFKWSDWQQSLKLDVPLHAPLPEFIYGLHKRLRLMARGRAMAAGPKLVADVIACGIWSLSDGAALAAAQDRILEQVDLLRARHPAGHLVEQA